jgi:hypothetical protein
LGQLLRRRTLLEVTGGCESVMRKTLKPEVEDDVLNSLTGLWSCARSINSWRVARKEHEDHVCFAPGSPSMQMPFIFSSLNLVKSRVAELGG